MLKCTAMLLNRAKCALCWLSAAHSLPACMHATLCELFAVTLMAPSGQATVRLPARAFGAIPCGCSSALLQSLNPETRQFCDPSILSQTLTWMSYVPPNYPSVLLPALRDGVAPETEVRARVPACCFLLAA